MRLPQRARLVGHARRRSHPDHSPGSRSFGDVGRSEEGCREVVDRDRIGPTGAHTLRFCLSQNVNVDVQVNIVFVIGITDGADQNQASRP